MKLLDMLPPPTDLHVAAIAASRPPRAGSGGGGGTVSHGLRKRSQSANRFGSGHSFSHRSRSGSGIGGGRKSEGEKDSITYRVVPPAIAILEQIALSISVTKEHADVRYVITANHALLHMAWRHARSFDEYRRLQKRLLKTLNHGHFCDADCPWLYTFLKSYFPKKNIFTFSSARVIQDRRDALVHFFMTVQNVLLNRKNHNCTVLTKGFAMELLEFIYGEVLNQYPLDQLGHTMPFFSSSARSQSMPILGVEDADLHDRNNNFSHSHSMSCATSTSASSCCQLCESSLYGEAFGGNGTPSVVSSGGVTASSSMLSDEEALELEAAASISSLVPPKLPASGSWNSDTAGRRSTHYITTLGCGHQFHDECIVPKLNETLRCPTCNHLEVQ